MRCPACHGECRHEAPRPHEGYIVFLLVAAVLLALVALVWSGAL